MKKYILNKLKYWSEKLPFSITKNQEYDKLTEKLILTSCALDSLCVDIGSHDGRILKLFIRYCPKKLHYAFEPIPSLFSLLKRKYGSAAKIFQIALSNKKGKSNFHYITTNAAYSGLKKRELKRKESIQDIEVDTNTLDNIISSTEIISFIKIDIEGGEYEALEGAKNTILRCKPIILFEFGKGAANYYEVTPNKMFTLFQTQFNYSINSLQSYLKKIKAFTLEDFENIYAAGSEYFFVAYPKE